MDSIALSTSYPDESNRTTVYDEIYDKTQVLSSLSNDSHYL